MEGDEPADRRGGLSLSLDRETLEPAAPPSRYPRIQLHCSFVCAASTRSQGHRQPCVC